MLLFDFSFKLLVGIIISIMLVLGSAGIYINYLDDTTVNEIHVKVVSVTSDYQRNSDGVGMTVYTILVEHPDGTNEVLESRDNYLLGKYSNKELILRLEQRVGDTVTLKVSGRGKSFLYDYRNIIEIIQ